MGGHEDVGVLYSVCMFIYVWGRGDLVPTSPVHTVHGVDVCTVHMYSVQLILLT